MDIVHWNGESLGCSLLLLLGVLALIFWALVPAIFVLAIVLLGIATIVLIPCTSYRFYFAYQKRKPGDMLGRYLVIVGYSILFWALVAEVNGYTEISHWYSSTPERIPNGFHILALFLGCLGVPLSVAGMVLGTVGFVREALPPTQKALSDFRARLEDVD